jgi:hypothetical protein
MHIKPFDARTVAALPQRSVDDTVRFSNDENSRDFKCQKTFARKFENENPICTNAKKSPLEVAGFLSFLVVESSLLSQ